MFSLPIEPILVFLLVFIRITMVLSFMPVFSDAFTPLTVRILLALVFAMVMAPIVHWSGDFFPQTISAFTIMMFGEAMLGAAMGLVGRMIFGTVQFAGAVIGEQIGFFNVTQLDPTAQGQIPVVGNLLFIMSLLIFFVTNAHHHFFIALGQSLQTAPPGFLLISENLHQFFIERSARMFVLAVQLSLPSIAIGLSIMFGAGMLAKSVPQINVFVESFPVRIMVGLMLLAITADSLGQLMVKLFEYMQQDLQMILKLFGV